MGSFKERLDGKLIEETAGHFDESDMAMYRAGARAALLLAAEDFKDINMETFGVDNGDVPRIATVRFLRACARELEGK